LVPTSVPVWLKKNPNIMNTITKNKTITYVEFILHNSASNNAGTWFWSDTPNLGDLLNASLAHERYLWQVTKIQQYTNC
jgi:hypothetical protein